MKTLFSFFPIDKKYIFLHPFVAKIEQDNFYAKPLIIKEKAKTLLCKKALQKFGNKKYKSVRKNLIPLSTGSFYYAGLSFARKKKKGRDKISFWGEIVDLSFWQKEKKKIFLPTPNFLVLEQKEAQRKEKILLRKKLETSFFGWLLSFHMWQKYVSYKKREVGLLVCRGMDQKRLFSCLAHQKNSSFLVPLPFAKQFQINNLKFFLLVSYFLSFLFLVYQRYCYYYREKKDLLYFFAIKKYFFPFFNPLHCVRQVFWVAAFFIKRLIFCLFSSPLHV